MRDRERTMATLKERIPRIPRIGDEVEYIGVNDNTWAVWDISKNDFARFGEHQRTFSASVTHGDKGIIVASYRGGFEIGAVIEFPYGTVLMAPSYWRIITPNTTYLPLTVKRKLEV
jgi:hypothetical protein